MDGPNRCHECGQARPFDATGEFCPRCLLRSGSGSMAIEESRSDRHDLLVTLGPGPRASWTPWPRSLSRVPQVHLHEADPGVGSLSGPLHPGEESHERVDRDLPDRLQLFGVIGRGGMGVVLKGHDTDLGRDLAVKVLREPFRDQPEMVRRFIEEAQIGGQLQHPGVVPVYELGTPRRPPALYRHAADPGPNAGRAARRARRRRPTISRGSWGSSNRSARRWPTRTPGA